MPNMSALLTRPIKLCLSITGKLDLEHCALTTTVRYWPTALLPKKFTAL